MPLHPHCTALPNVTPVKPNHLFQIRLLAVYQLTSYFRINATTRYSQQPTVNVDHMRRFLALRWEGEGCLPPSFLCGRRWRSAAVSTVLSHMFVVSILAQPVKNLVYKSVSNLNHAWLPVAAAALIQTYDVSWYTDLLSSHTRLELLPMDQLAKVFGQLVGAAPCVLYLAR